MSFVCVQVLTSQYYLGVVTGAAAEHLAGSAYSGLKSGQGLCILFKSIFIHPTDSPSFHAKHFVFENELSINHKM